MKPTHRIAAVAGAFVLTGCATLTIPTPPSIPHEPPTHSLTLRWSVDMPSLPPEPSIDQAPVPRESFRGFRYVPTMPTAATAGEIEVAVETSSLGVIRTVDFTGKPLLVQPTGLVVWVVVRNNSDHIVDLAHSILQFEDDKGHEYAIEERGWTGSTIAFIDSICDQYVRGASVLVDQYRASLDVLLVDVRARTAAAQGQNNDALTPYARLVRDSYAPLFGNYVTEVDKYNRQNYLFSYKKDGIRKKIFRQKPYVIGIDERLRPDRLIDEKRQEIARANRQLEQAVQSFESEIKRRIDALRARLLSAVEERRAEWKKAVESLPLGATKVVRGNGRFDPIVIPPAKHRTLFVPGIRNLEGRDREPLEWPSTTVSRNRLKPALSFGFRDLSSSVVVRDTRSNHAGRGVL